MKMQRVILAIAIATMGYVSGCGSAEQQVSGERPAVAVRVQVLAPDGRPIPGFARTDCRAVQGDVLAAPVRWRRPLSALQGRPVRVEFFLNDAHLFAFDLQPLDRPVPVAR